MRQAPEQGFPRSPRGGSPWRSAVEQMHPQPTEDPTRP